MYKFCIRQIYIYISLGSSEIFYWNKKGKKYDFSPFMKLPLSSSICQEWILCWLNLFCPKEEKSCHKTRNEKKIQLWKPRVYIARILIFDIYNAKLVALSILILYSPEHGIFFCDKISKEKIYIKIGFRPKKKMLRTVIFYSHPVNITVDLQFIYFSWRWSASSQFCTPSIVSNLVRCQNICFTSYQAKLIFQLLAC